MKTNPKFYVVVRADLPLGDQAVQAIHAATEFGFQHGSLAQEWHRNSNYLALLSVPNERALEKLKQQAYIRDIPHACFREPDLNNSLTAIALEPGDRSERLCNRLPLAMSM
jgi:peptidyl-tRNA hydrolase